VAAVEEERGAVASVELDEVVATDYAAGVVGHSDDEVEDDVVCEKLEEVVSVSETLQALSMMRKNGSKARKPGARHSRTLAQTSAHMTLM
jgi:hypothetical protein